MFRIIRYYCAKYDEKEIENIFEASDCKSPRHSTARNMKLSWRSMRQKRGLLQQPPVVPILTQKPVTATRPSRYELTTYPSRRSLPMELL